MTDLTTTRRFRINESTEVLLSDTVGLILKLPTHLIEAFKYKFFTLTLESLSYLSDHIFNFVLIAFIIAL